MNDIKQLVAEVVVTLNNELTDATMSDASKRYAVIKDALNHAFKQVASVQIGETEEEKQRRETERKQLYRQLGLTFHPDKLLSSEEPFAAKLNHYKCVSDAQQIIESYKERTFFESAITSSSYTMDSLTKILLSMMKRQDEYPVFIQSEVKLASGISLFLGVAGLFIENCIAILAILITRSALQGITNGLTKGKLNKILADFKDNYPLDYNLIKNQVITDLKSAEYTANCQIWVEEHPDATPDETEASKAEIYNKLFSLSEDDYLTSAQVTYDANGIPNHFTDKLSEAILNTNFNRAQFVCEAFLTNIMASIETSSDLDFAIALIARGLLVTAAIIMVPLTFVADSVIKFVVEPLANIVIPGLLFTVVAAVLLTLNSPIYTLDIIHATLDYISAIIDDCISTDEHADSTLADPIQKSPRTPSTFEFFSAETTVREETQPNRFCQPAGAGRNMAEMD